MITPSDTEAETPELQHFNSTAKKGWDGFTKFLLSNVIAVVAGLLFVGLLTVWR
jgi:hypothetical protein